MIDEKDIKKLAKVLATKKDLESFATKKDIEGFATKKDVKDIVSGAIDSLALMVGKGFAGVDKRFDRIENVLIKRHDEEIVNLKKRISRLEEALAIK